MINKIVITLVAVISLAAGLYFSGAFKPPVAIEARVFEPARSIKPFELINQYGQPINNQLFNDKWTFIFLGFTHCPDICPTTLAKLANSYKRLKQTADNSQVMFVSVDPNRDTSERLKEYTDYFNSEFIAASGEHKALYPFVRSIALLYSMTDDTTKPDYEVSHSGSIVLINPQGQLQAMFKPIEALGQIPHVDMEILERDFAEIVDRF